jgi:superfamily II DNA or RNA helicase
LRSSLLGATYQVAVAELPADYLKQPWYTRLTIERTVSSVCPTKPAPLVTTALDKPTGILHLPRFAGLLHFGVPQRDVRSTGVAMTPHLRFTGTLCAESPPQVQATSAVVEQLSAIGGAMLVLPCGFGKTVCALWIAHNLKRRTLIIVHADALGAQWIERIRMFLPDAVIGRIQQDVLVVEGCDIVVCMMQSLLKRTYEPAMLASFGLVILDEAHHVAAPMFSKALPKLTARYVLGLSATPDRIDGCGVALEWLLGPIAFKAARVYERVRVHMITYTRGDQEELVNRRGDPLCSTMLTHMAADVVRTRLLVTIIMQQWRAQRNTIVLSDRLDQLSAMEEALTREGCDSVARVVGGTKAKDREKGFNAKVIMSTYTYAAEGLDIPRLDTLVMATPRGNIEQSVGRILRPYPNKREPTIFDVKDPFSLFEGMGWKRHRYYKSQSYCVTLVDDTEMFPVSSAPPPLPTPPPPPPPPPVAAAEKEEEACFF